MLQGLTFAELLSGVERAIFGLSGSSIGHAATGAIGQEQPMDHCSTKRSLKVARGILRARTQ